MNEWISLFEIAVLIQIIWRHSDWDLVLKYSTLTSVVGLNLHKREF